MWGASITGLAPHTEETLGEGRHGCHRTPSTPESVGVVTSDDLSPTEVSLISSIGEAQSSQGEAPTAPPACSSWLRKLTPGARYE
ncbi:hypothetical protein [Calothrix sp. NIES-2098]|uniref:hypothetical protein n=1 Tax=Calothrix sp. NIES-2098 TaxID=1954171 RepID=UPI0030DA7764